MKMDFRLAVMADLPQLKAVYQNIIHNMNQNHIKIWDDIYPCGVFENDIRNHSLYILTHGSDIISAFALCGTSPGENAVRWQKPHPQKVLYLSRFGVHVDYLKRGIGSLMLQHAKETAKNLGVRYLRLFVVDINQPAIQFYIKNGFTKANGIYEDMVENHLVLRQYGLEVALYEKPLAPR